MDKRRDRGSATVELAMALPAVVMLLALVLGVGAWGMRAVATANAAGTAARVAVTDGAAAGVAAGQRIAGADASVTVAVKGGWIVATVVSPSPVWGMDVTATATAKGQS